MTGSVKVAQMALNEEIVTFFADEQFKFGTPPEKQYCKFIGTSSPTTNPGKLPCNSAFHIIFTCLLQPT